MQTRDEKKQSKKEAIEREMAYWQQRFNKSIAQARRSIFKTINAIEKEKKKLNMDNIPNANLPDE